MLRRKLEEVAYSSFFSLLLSLYLGSHCAQVFWLGGDTVSDSPGPEREGSVVMKTEGGREGGSYRKKQEKRNGSTDLPREHTRKGTILNEKIQLLRDNLHLDMAACFTAFSRHYF